MLEELDITKAETYMEDVRQIGAAKQKRLRRREPGRQWLREVFQIKEAEKEYAAYRAWRESLTPEEEAEILERYPTEFPGFGGTKPRGPLFKRAWEAMSPQEKFQELTTPEAIGPMSIHYHRDTNYYPSVAYEKQRFNQD